ncbi:MAG: hypothetical protein P4L50_10480 [Anaerolineaceae bacterium]|nr:hypothetical protein [Anaerolineaceae bacterium]
MNQLTTNTLSGTELVRLNRLLFRDAYLSIAAVDYGAGSPDSSGTADIYFTVQQPPELKIRKTQTPPEYHVVLNPDGRLGDVLTLHHPDNGFVSTNVSLVKVIKEKFGHFGLGDGCDDASKAPGQGAWLIMGPGCNEDTNRIALEWSVSLGRTFDGLAAGQLALREQGLSRDTYTPFAIYYNGSLTNLYATETLVDTNLPYLITNSDATVTTNVLIPVQSQNIWCLTNIYTNELSVIVTNVQTITNYAAPVVLTLKNLPYFMTNSAGDVYTNYDTVIRQVRACQTFIDVLAPDTNQTVLKFYLASQVGTNRDETGLFTSISGSPFVTWTIQNPEPASADKLNVIEDRNGNVSTQILVKTVSSGVVTWDLKFGTGAEQREEIREVSFNGVPATNRIEVNRFLDVCNG